MKTHLLKPKDFNDLVYHQTDEFLKMIDSPDLFIVQGMYDPVALRAIRDQAFEWGQTTEPSWHPCLDGCPAYHRLHETIPRRMSKPRSTRFTGTVSTSKTHR